ncbi:MAG: 2-phospho-L-lactate guanylyltransferase [Solirubrobacteraceae bacterium]
MATVAILPVKHFAAAKERLGDKLTPGTRRALAEAMFSDVLVALRRARRVEEILVVTADAGAQQIAAGHGATPLGAEERGHTTAAELGVDWALESGADRALLVPGDCPLLVPAQLDQLIERAAGPRSALIVPDRHGTGTNALLLTPPDSMAPAFGAGSRERHVVNARALGIEHEVVEVPSLALDVDTIEDLAAVRELLAVTHGAAANTRGMLSQLLRSTM